MRVGWILALVLLDATLAAGEDLSFNRVPETSTTPWTAPSTTPALVPPSADKTIAQSAGPSPSAGLVPNSLDHYAPSERSPGVAPSPLSDRIVESTWYARVDYFHWNERLDGQDFVKESGPLYTLGYIHRNGPERFRFELFGGDMDYDGGAQSEDGTSEPLYSTTGYIGARGEYDLLFEPTWMPQATFLIGVGSRFWLRDLKDGRTPSGDYVMGYQETWWTIYPYLGMETRHVPGEDIEWFASGKIGMTAYTYEYATLFETTLHPRLGVTGQLEAGLRGRWLQVSGYFEGMTWGESHVVREVLQPVSRMYTVGLKAGVSF